jgi:hypothetical protein
MLFYLMRCRREEAFNKQRSPVSERGQITYEREPVERDAVRSGANCMKPNSWVNLRENPQVATEVAR